MSYYFLCRFSILIFTPILWTLNIDKKSVWSTFNELLLYYHIHKWNSWVSSQLFSMLEKLLLFCFLEGQHWNESIYGSMYGCDYVDSCTWYILKVFGCTGILCGWMCYFLSYSLIIIYILALFIFFVYSSMTLTINQALV